MSNHTADIAPPAETLFDELMEASNGFNQNVRAVLMSEAAVEAMKTYEQVKDCVEQGGDPDKCLEAALMGTLYFPWMESINMPFPPPGPEALSGTFGYRMLESMHSHVSKMKDLLEMELESRKPE